jgi:NHL repeat
MRTFLLSAAIVAAVLVFGGGVSAASSATTSAAAAAPGFVGAWTTPDQPYDVSTNALGEVWVMYPDTPPAAPRLVRYDVNGKVITTVTLQAGDQPTGISTDPAGNVYVADASSDTIELYGDTGGILASFGGDPDKLDEPAGLTVDSQENEYVADGTNDRIDEFDRIGNLLATFGEGVLDHPAGVAILGGNLYVTDSGNDRVVEFSPAGSVLTTFGTSGSGAGQFDLPLGISAAGGNLVVSDDNNHRIQEFSPSGQFVLAFGQGGGGNGEFTENYGVSIDGIGNIFVADAGNNRVQRFFQGLNPCTQLTGAYLSTCGAARKACLAMLTDADEQSCLDQTNAKYDVIRKEPKCKRLQKSTKAHPCRLS